MELMEVFTMADETIRKHNVGTEVYINKINNIKITFDGF